MQSLLSLASPFPPKKNHSCPQRKRVRGVRSAGILDVKKGAKGMDIITRLRQSHDRWVRRLGLVETRRTVRDRKGSFNWQRGEGLECQKAKGRRSDVICTFPLEETDSRLVCVKMNEWIARRPWCFFFFFFLFRTSVGVAWRGRGVHDAAWTRHDTSASHGMFPVSLLRGLAGVSTVRSLCNSSTNQPHYPDLA
jgi:hypothetical protein